MMQYIEQNQAYTGKKDAPLLLMKQFMNGLKSKLDPYSETDKLDKIILYIEILMDILKDQGYTTGLDVGLGPTTTLDPVKIKTVSEMIRILSSTSVDKQKEYLLRILNTIHQLLHSVPDEKTNGTPSSFFFTIKMSKLSFLRL